MNSAEVREKMGTRSLRNPKASNFCVTTGEGIDQRQTKNISRNDRSHFPQLSTRGKEAGVAKDGPRQHGRKETILRVAVTSARKRNLAFGRREFEIGVMGWENVL